MNCKQANQIRIQDFLNSQGFKPVYFKKNRYLWYRAPYRRDTNPSFVVDTKDNKWYDKGTATGGTTVDLAILLHNTDLTGALMILEKRSTVKPILSFLEEQKNNSSSIKINKIQPLQNRKLIEYLSQRKISQSTAVNFIQECYYYAFPGQTKPYYGICWQNVKKGYHIQNSFGRKVIAGSTGVTLIKGTDNAANIFEGMINFLSALEYYKIREPESTIIILNSITNLESIKDSLKEYSQLNLFLDNDTPGEKTATKIKLIHSRVKDYSKIIFPGFNDFNDFICKKPAP
jgi:hypothetical protein